MTSRYYFLLLTNVKQLFNILNMSSIDKNEKKIGRFANAEDLTAKARIFDAAIEAFARYGNNASVRSIAEVAGVSPGLVIHHFGSKSALREACDNEVLKRYHELEIRSVMSPATAVKDAVTISAEAAMVLVYMLRCLIDGGASARSFMKNLLVETESVMKASLERGLINPSVNEPARSEFWSRQTLGYMLLTYLLEQPDDPVSFVKSIWDHTDLLIAQVESMTVPIFKDDSIFKAVLELYGRLEK